MNASWVTAQDFTTSELIEALRQRGFRVLDKAASDEIAASERAAMRRKLGELFSREHACVQSEYQAVIAWLDAREPKSEPAGEAQREGDVDSDMKLYLVIDEISGKAGVFTLAENTERAKENARGILSVEPGAAFNPKAVTDKTAIHPRTRAMLALGEKIALEAVEAFGVSPEEVSKELNQIDVLRIVTCAVFERELAKAIADEREACVTIARDMARRAVEGETGFARSAAAIEIENAIKARSSGTTKA